MSKIVFKISMNRCKEKGFYNSTSTFLDLEKNLQKHFKISLDRCKEIGDVKLNQLRKDKNIDEYRELIRNTKNYQKTSISLVFDLSDHIIKKYSLSDPNNEDGKKRFQDDYIFKEKNVSTEVSTKTPIASQKEDSDDTPELSDVGMTEDDQSFPEGKKKLRQHLVRERNQALVSRKKGIAKKEAKLSCCICEFSFEEYYGDIGRDYIEAHHVLPVSELKEDCETRLEDIVLVCSNCHRILHRKRPWLGADELKSILKSRE